MWNCITQHAPNTLKKYQHNHQISFTRIIQTDLFLRTIFLKKSIKIVKNLINRLTNISFYLLDDHFYAFFSNDDNKNLRLFRSLHTVNPIQFNVFRKRTLKGNASRNCSMCQKRTSCERAWSWLVPVHSCQWSIGFMYCCNGSFHQNYWFNLDPELRN